MRHFFYLFKKYNKNSIVESAGAVEFTDHFSTEEQGTPTRVLDMTLNNMMVRF